MLSVLVEVQGACCSHVDPEVTWSHHGDDGRLRPSTAVLGALFVPPTMPGSAPLGGTESSKTWYEGVLRILPFCSIVPGPRGLLITRWLLKTQHES